VTFLAPMAGIIAAAICVPTLIVLYLLKLRRRPVRVSSTMLWRSALRDAQANVPLARLRLSLLLLLQLLALAALITALARPAVPGEGVAGRRVVIVIDRSASMLARDGRAGTPSVDETANDSPDAATASPTRLDEARERALRLINDAPGDQQLMVVQAANEARALTTLTADRAALRDAVRSVEPTDQPGDLGAALNLVRSLLAPEIGPDESVDRPVVVVLSDGVSSAGATNANPAVISGLDVRFVPVGSTGGSTGRAKPSAGIEPPTPPTPTPAPASDGLFGYDNVGIVAVGARRDFDNPASVRVFVRVRNADVKPATITLRLTRDGEALRTNALRLPPSTLARDAGPGAPAGTLSPGEATSTFAFDDTAGGVLSVNIGRRDLLASDNSASIVLRPAQDAGVLLVAPGTPPAPDPYLLDAVRASRGDRVRVVNLAGLDSEISAGRVGRGAGAPWGAVVFDRVTPTRPPPASSLSFGAGMPAFESSPAVVVEPVAPPTGSPEGSRSRDRVLTWDRDHPVMRGLALDNVLIAPASRLRIDAQGESSGTIDTLATGLHGPIIAMRRDGRSGAFRRFVVAFPIEHSTWLADRSFPIFVTSALDALTLKVDASARGWVSTIEPASVQAARGSRKVSLVGPHNFRAEIPVPELDASESADVSLGVLARAGLYRVAGAVGPATTSGADGAGGTTSGDGAVVAVNMIAPDATMCRVESELRLGASPVTGTSASSLGGVTEVWVWFVAAALLLLTIEWCLYAWGTRR
jgi:hypothetical protein